MQDIAEASGAGRAALDALGGGAGALVLLALVGGLAGAALAAAALGAGRVAMRGGSAGAVAGPGAGAGAGGNWPVGELGDDDRGAGRSGLLGGLLPGRWGGAPAWPARRRDEAGGPRPAQFRIEDGVLRVQGRAAPGAPDFDGRGRAECAAALVAVEGATDLRRALHALETDGRAFDALVEDADGRAWELSGRPEAGEARLSLVPAGPSRREIARLRNMLEVLAAERELAEEALEVAPLPVWRRGPAGQVVWGNALYRRLAGARDGRVGAAGEPLPELHCEGGARDRATARSETRRAFGPGGGRPQGRRAVFDALTGERRWFELVETPSADGGVLGYALDAAAAVHAEGALRRFVETLTETFAHLAIGLAIFDRETRLGLFNPAFASLMKLDPAWLAGRPTLSEVLERLRANRRMPDHEDFRSWRSDMLDLFAAEGEPMVDRPERTEVWHLPGEEQIRVVARPHPQGAVAFLFEDVSETARLERRFLTETEIRRAVMDRLEEGVVAFGPDGAARFANPAFAAMWGLGGPPGAAAPAAAMSGAAGTAAATSGAAAGRLSFASALAMFHRRAPSASAWDRLARFFADPSTRAAWSEEVALEDGRRLRARVAALPDGSVLAAFTDVTDASRASTAMRERTAALEAAEEIRGALLEQVSGRVRTPLARISGLGLALRDEAAGEGASERALQRLDAMLEAAAEVQAALTGVADLASAQAGVLSLSAEQVNLRQALASALDVARRRAAERGVTLSLETPEAEPGPGREGEAAEETGGVEEVTADAARMRQLLFNLVADAVQRAEPGAEIRAGARRRGDVVEIWTDEPAPPRPVAAPPAEAAPAASDEGRAAGPSGDPGATAAGAGIDADGDAAAVAGPRGRGASGARALRATVRPVSLEGRSPEARSPDAAEAVGGESGRAEVDALAGREGPEGGLGRGPGSGAGAEEAPRAGLAFALVRRFAELHGGEVRLDRIDAADGEPRLRVVCALPVSALHATPSRGGAAVA